MPWLTRRSAEWGLMVLVILVLIGVFGQQFRVVQAQGELAAVKTTLGALRTALVIDHLQGATTNKAQHRAMGQGNPFLLLYQVPANYAGIFDGANAAGVPAGNWVFDAYCNCIGYAPMYSYALEGAGDAPMAWFRISAPPGPLQISPVQAYYWQGELLN